MLRTTLSSLVVLVALGGCGDDATPSDASAGTDAALTDAALVLELAQRALARQGIDEAKATLEGDARMFSLDPTLVARALANLVRNAETHGGGLTQIVVHVDEGLRIDVRDSGPGLGEAQDSEGLGLGLPLVRAIAAAHQGELRFERDADAHVARFKLAPPTKR